VQALDAPSAPGAAGASVASVDARGVSALHLAVRSASVEATRALLDAGADRTTIDNKGLTAGDLAALVDAPAVLALFADAPARPLWRARSTPFARLPTPRTRTRRSASKARKCPAPSAATTCGG
jgi:ankyrin repeat protein